MLAKKYTFLRICYNIFLFGIIVAVIAFLVAIVYHNATVDTVSMLRDVTQ